MLEFLHSFTASLAIYQFTISLAGTPIAEMPANSYAMSTTGIFETLITALVQVITRSLHFRMCAWYSLQYIGILRVACPSAIGQIPNGIGVLAFVDPALCSWHRVPRRVLSGCPAWAGQLQVSQGVRLAYHHWLQHWSVHGCCDHNITLLLSHTMAFATQHEEVRSFINHFH